MTTNWMRAVVLVFATVIGWTSSAHSQDICHQLSGSVVVATDGTFLGTIESSYSSDSILNSYGQYGNEFGTNSIWNRFGTYGGEFSRQSPFNEFSRDAPYVLKNGVLIARLSVNQFLQNAVNPYWIKGSCR